MGKPKRKAKQQNFWQYIWLNFFVPECDFAIETDLATDDCVKRIRAIKEEEHGCFEPIHFTGDAYLIENTEIFEFTLTAQHEFGTNARLIGTIKKVDESRIQLNGISRVTNWTSAIASLILGILISFWIMMANTGNVICQIIILPVLFILLFFHLWFGMYDDRNKLIRILERTLQQESSHV